MPNLDTLEIVAGIEEAIHAIKGRSTMVVNGATPIFMKLHHAKEHLEKEVADLLAPEPEPAPVDGEVIF